MKNIFTIRNLFGLFTLIVLFHYFFFLFGFSFTDGININFYLDKDITLEKKGQLGDFTAGHFSILAFLWLAYSILIQSREFGLQRKEFENQTEQFKEQNKLYNKQLKELEIQSKQNKLDRYVQKLSDLESKISKKNNITYTIYEFFNDCERSNDLKIHSNKLNTLEEYVKLYKITYDFIRNDKDLLNEFEALKSDIYSGIIISYLVILTYIIKNIPPKNATYAVEISPKNVLELSKKKIYKLIEGNIDVGQSAFQTVFLSTNKLNDIPNIDIFEKIEDL